MPLPADRIAWLWEPSTLASGQSSTAVGAGAQATGRSATSLGNGSAATADRAVGVGGAARASYATAVGYGANALGTNSIALGRGTVAADTSDSFAAGRNSYARGTNDIALGHNAVADGTTAMALGTNAKTYDAEGIASDAAELSSVRNNYTIAGHEITYVDTSNTASNMVAVGDYSKAAGWGASAFGVQAYALNSQASALGDDSKALGYASSAVGTHTYASGMQSTALGNGAEAISDQAAALGAGSAATGSHSVAVGYGAGASGLNAIAIGTYTGSVYNWQTDGGGTSTTETELGQWAASGDNSIALGTDAISSATDSMALGHGAAALSNGGVALGSSSSVTRSAGTEGGPGWGTAALSGNWANWVEAKNSTQNADGTWITSNDPDSTVWTSSSGAVSIGTDGQDGNTYTRQLTGLAAGTADTDAVNVSQWKNTMLATVGDAKEDSSDTRYGTDGVARNVTRLYDESLTLTGAGDDGTTLTKDQLSTDANIGTIVGDNKITFRLAKDLTGLDSVTTGNTSISNGGLTVKAGDSSQQDITIQQGSVSMGGNQIHNVAAGTAPTDAVNVSQLQETSRSISSLSSSLDKLGTRVDRVGAGAAALAALHPQDFDPDDKWDFAAGYGNYRGANAAAAGAFYHPNEDTTFSIGGTVGGGENMINAGFSIKLGQNNHVSNSRVAMAKELLALKDYIKAQNKKIERLETLVGQGQVNTGKRRSILFPDVPENHWAYVYVKNLADRGLLEGYLDGEFKGGRTMTRYEFAAIFSRALENGVGVDADAERMSEEFEPEIRELSLNRFRVDRVAGEDNDRHKIERVRVNDRDEMVQNKNGENVERYRDIYGGVIEKDAAE